jgi:hypothetical protein
MAERIVSPGVFTRENDLSFLAQGVGEIGAAFIGPFKQGPAFVPTIVRTQSEFEDVFGTPDGTFYTEYAVQNYLREAGSATIVRVGGIGGYADAGGIALVASGSGVGKYDYPAKLVAVLQSTTVGSQYQQIQFTGSVISNNSDPGLFLISSSAGGAFDGGGVSASIKPSATNDVSDVFGESPFGDKDGYTYVYFENEAAKFNAPADSGSVYHISLPVQNYGYDVSYASTPWVKSQTISGQRYELFKFHTLGDGTIYNTKYKIGISNVKAAGEDGSTLYSTFTVTIRSFGDTDKRKSVVETFNNVNLDPTSPNYIARRIGDRVVTIDNNGKITEEGDYTNRSKYVRVEVADQGSFPISAAPFGHEAYTNPIYVGGGNDSLVPAVTYSTGSAINTAASPIYYSGIDLETNSVKIDNLQYLKPLPVGALVGANIDFAFDSQLNYQMTGSNSADMVKRQFIVSFQGGFDGLNPIVKPALGSTISGANTQGFDCSNSTASGSVAYSKAISAISNADEWDINLVVTPGIIRSLHPSVTTKVIDMVEDRQDAFYIADLVGATDTISDVTFQSNQIDSNYVGTYYPWVKTIDNNTNKLTSVPPSVLLPAVYAANDRLAGEWFAPAGLNRGGITGAVSVLNRLTHSERDTLYENKVNPIAAFPGQGIVSYGQKTLQDKSSALDRINVRRLLIAVKKFVASTSRFLVFEQNTSTTRNRFLNTVNPYFEAIQQRQGLYAFNVVMDETNNTPDVIDRNILAGQIFLQPAKTAEFIVIDFNILPTGGAAFNA